MGAFSTKKDLKGNPSLIPFISSAVEDEFRKEGYDVTVKELLSGGKDISITKGGLFKAIVGLKTALKIKLLPKGDSIAFDAGIGMFGLQAVPTAISLFVTWPVLLTQIWGLIKQSKLDNKALEIAEREINRHPAQIGVYTVCPFDGMTIPAGSEYCPYCGKKVC